MKSIYHRVGTLYPKRTVAGSGQERGAKVKSVIYYYDAIEGEEELHEDEEVAKLVKGEVIERNGEYWRITEVLTTTGLGTPKPLR